MDNDLILKALVLFVSIPWWLPVARQVIRDVWSEGTPVAQTQDASLARASGERFTRERSGWSPGRTSRGLYNSRWAIGRPDVKRRAGFGRARR